MGDSPEAIPTRLARGETADVVILDGGAADELAKRGIVRAGSKIDLAKSQIGMVVRAGAAKPNISSVEGFKRTLLDAASIALGQRQWHISRRRCLRSSVLPIRWHARVGRCADLRPANQSLRSLRAAKRKSVFNRSASSYTLLA